MIQKFEKYCNSKKRNYKNVKSIIKNDYDVDVNEKELEEYENTLVPDKHVNKDYQQGKMYISNNDFAAKYAEEFLKRNEDAGAGTATAGNSSGMGAVSTATPSATPGQTTGGDGFATQVAGDSYGNGGVGSGDIGSGWNKSKSNNRKERKKKKEKSNDATKSFGKNLNNVADFSSYKKGGDKNAIQTFTEYSKKS